MTIFGGCASMSTLYCFENPPFLHCYMKLKKPIKFSLDIIATVMYSEPSMPNFSLKYICLFKGQKSLSIHLSNKYCIGSQSKTLVVYFIHLFSLRVRIIHFNVEFGIKLSHKKKETNFMVYVILGFYVCLYSRDQLIFQPEHFNLLNLTFFQPFLQF